MRLKVRLAFVFGALIASATAACAEDQTPTIRQSTTDNFTNITVTGKGTFDDVIRSVKALSFVPAVRDAALI